MKHKLTLAALTLASSLNLYADSDPRRTICDPSLIELCYEINTICEPETVQANYKKNYQSPPQNLKELFEYTEPRTLDDKLYITLLGVAGLLGVYHLINENLKNRKDGKSRKDNQ